MSSFNQAADLLAEQVGEKVFVASQATGAASASLALNALKDVNAQPLRILDAVTGLPLLDATPLLALQADQDFYYNLTLGAGTAAAGTSVLVKAGAVELVRLRADRSHLNVIQSSVAGTVKVFVIR